MKKLIFPLLLLLLSFSNQAQEIVKSANEKISGKAAAGTWIDYSVNPEENNISFTFETKKNKKSAKYETYTFDLDLNYQGMEEKELEFEKAKAKFISLKTPQTATKALRVGKNLVTGQMVLETGTINYGYAGRALITTFNTEQKVKPKGEDGSKLLLVHSRTENPAAFGTAKSSFFGQARNDVKVTTTTGSLRPISYNVGDVMAVVYEKSDQVFQKYAFLVYDAKSLSRKLTKAIHFDKAYRPIYARDMPNGDMALIFLPIMKHETPKSKKGNAINAHDKPNFKYLRINMKGETIAEVDFELPKPKIGLPYTLSLIPHSDPANTTVYLTGYGGSSFLGMGVKENAASFAATHGNQIPRMTNMTAKKLDMVIMGKMTDKMEYLNTMAPADFWAKAKTPSGSKIKAPTGSEASKFFLSGLYIQEATSLGDDDLLVGNNWEGGHLFVVQTDKSGNLKNVFLENRGKVSYQEAVVVPRAGGEAMIIFTHQAHGKDEGQIRENNYQRSIEASRINLSAGTITTARPLLPKKHFVDLVEPRGLAVVIVPAERLIRLASMLRW